MVVKEERVLGLERKKRLAVGEESLGFRRKKRLVMKEESLGFGRKKRLVVEEERVSSERVTKTWFLFCLRRDMTLENN